MKIEQITLREIRMPLVHFFETSFGRTTDRNIVLVEIVSEGLSAWGECVAGEHPFYSEESYETAWYALEQYLAPALAGRSVEHGAEVPALLPKIRGHRMAKAALENAVWELEARAKNVPLWRLLGGTRQEIDCGVSIGIQDTIEQLLGKIETELTAGYQRIKVKCKPGWDIDVFRRIRERWPDILLSCDANSAYTTNDFDHLKRFDLFNLLMMEQPLWSDDFYFHSKLQKQIKTHICLDEVIRSARDAQAAIELGACGIINVKVGRVGGMSEAIKVHNIAQAAGIPVWCGGMLESGIGRWQNVALSTLPNFSLPGDVSASKRYWKEDIVEPEVAVSARGTITVPTGPGSGFEVKRDLIERLTARKAVIKHQSVGA
ncbi:MAG TPA: o-succinylbenzoate synthase [Terriglobales bacterium]|jgi:O-succinylbenzoate synthase